MKNYSLALVTGATSGIGLSLCTLLASKGIPLFITGRDQEKLERLAASFSVPVISCAANLAHPEERKKLIQLIHDHLPDLVINNAGFGLYGDALDFTTEEQMEILEVNGNAVLEICLESARALITNKKRGTIINISSAAAFFPFPSFSVYAATKRFVLQLSQSLDEEMAPLGVRILCSCPGQVETHFRGRAAQGAPQKKSGMALSKERAALYIWEQIEKKSPCAIFDFRTRLGVLLSLFIPNFLLMKFLRKAVLDRIVRATKA